MKKILGISLCALFAVSAANAEITSRGYVDQVVGANTTRINTLDTAIAGMNQTQTQGDYVTFVKQEGGQVTASGASFAPNVATGGTNAPTSAAVVAYVEGQVSELEVGDLANRVTANESAIGENATKIATNDSRIAANAGNITTNKNDITALTAKVGTNETNIGTNTQAITALQATAEGLGALAFEDAVTSAEIADRTIVNADIKDDAAIASSKIAFDTTQNTVFGSGIDSTKVGQIATNTGSINSLNGSVTALEGRVGTNEGNISTLTEKVDAMNAESTTGQYVKYVKQENGKVIAEGTSFDTSVSDTSNNAPTSKAVAGHVATYVTNNAVQTVESGTTNGTIKVDGQEVSVAGLGSAAYTDASTLATTANITALQGNIADVQDEIDEIEQEMVTTGNNLEAQTNLLASIVNAAGYQNCANESGCTLVRDSNGFKWEAVTREVSAQ